MQTHPVHTIEKLLHDIWILHDPTKRCKGSLKRTAKHELTFDIAPGTLIAFNEQSSNTDSALLKIACASLVGPVLFCFDSNIGGGGFSCAIRIAASDSHTAVSCRCAARHTSSNSGPAGREISVVSFGRHVMDLNRSLRAYKSKDRHSMSLESEPG
jgi:hypothetical protein